MKLGKLDIKKTRKFFKRLPQTLAEKSFLSFLFLFTISLVFGAIVFYRHESSIKKASPKILEKTLQIEEKSYQEVLRVWEEKKEGLNEIDFREYPNLFR